MAEDATITQRDDPRRDLRRELKARRTALGAAERIAAAEGLARQLAQLPEMSRPGYLAGYWAVGGEISLHAVMTRLAEGVVYCLPCLREDGGLGFAPWRPGDPLAANRFGIPEPDVARSSLLEPEALSVVLMPLLGFSRDGTRLGMGGGWYDRSFAFRRTRPAPPLLIAVGYAIQECSGLAAEDWDVRPDLLVTERETLRHAP